MAAEFHPLRTALIGLSSSAITSWAANAHLPSLLSETGRSKFAIKALLNSSTDAAQSAIKLYNLPADTKAYGSPEDLAADPDIDLVICNTRVDKHYETIIPSVRAGKKVFVEWPIAAKEEHIEQLVEAARQSGSQVAVGLQRRWNPIIAKVRELVVGDGRLGKILSADVRLFGGTHDRDILPLGLKYFAQKDIGGNPIVIGVGHDLEAIQAKTQIQRPNVPVRDPSTNKIVDQITSNVPDLLTFNTRLQPSPRAAKDATLSFFFRRGQPFPGTPSLSFTINLEHGEIRVVSPSATSLEASESEEPITIQIHWFDDNRVENVEWSWTPKQLELPLMARSVSETLYAFADGRPAGEGWVSLEDAAHRAKLLEKLVNA